MVTGMAMSMSSVSVVVSSLLLQWYRKPLVHSDGSISITPNPLAELVSSEPRGSSEDLYHIVESPRRKRLSLHDMIQAASQMLRTNQYTRIERQNIEMV